MKDFDWFYAPVVSIVPTGMDNPVVKGPLGILA
jgi:hypothetical protein